MKTAAILACMAILLVSAPALAQSPADPVVEELEPACAALHAALASQGVADEVPVSHPPQFQPQDPLADHDNCRDLRDAVEHEAYGGRTLPSRLECHRINGSMTCVGYNWYGCDLALAAGYGIYVCMGGLYPYR